MLVPLITASCGVHNDQVRAERSGVPIVAYTCDYQIPVLDSMVEMTSTALLECRKGNDKLLWLWYWVPGCSENSRHVAMAKRYADKVDLVCLAVRWEYPKVKAQMEQVPYPIYFLDRNLPKNVPKNLTAFTQQLIENEEAVAVGSNVFIKNGRLVHHCFDEGLDDALINQLAKPSP